MLRHADDGSEPCRKDDCLKRADWLYSLIGLIPERFISDLESGTMNNPGYGMNGFPILLHEPIGCRLVGKKFEQGLIAPRGAK